MVFSVVLAGGLSRRFGQDKCTYQWRGKPLIDWVIDALSKVTDSIYIAAGRNAHLYKGREVLEDSPRFSGPLAAVDSAVARIRDVVVFTPCDVPYAKPVIFEKLLEIDTTFSVWVYPNGRVESTIFKIDGRRSVEILNFLAKYKRNRIDDMFRLGETTFLSIVKHGVDPLWLLNVNKPQDLENSTVHIDEVFVDDVKLVWEEPPLKMWLTNGDVEILKREFLRYLEVGLFSVAAHVAKDISRDIPNFKTVADLLYRFVEIRKVN